MKKIKIMMMVIFVMAIVGGALAFKANRFDKQWCTRAVANGPGPCETSLPDYRITNVPPSIRYWFTETNNPGNCTTIVNRPDCTSSTFFTSE